jgi:hypothetical protein
MDRYAYLQPWDHGPIWVSNPYQARCGACDWTGPLRDAGDPHAAALTLDDAVEHAHAVGALCGKCEPCCQQIEAKHG